jgi:hypothetical protein
MEKLCNKCLVIKPLFSFSIDKRSKNGYQTRCKPCQAEVKKEMAPYYRNKHLEAKYGINQVVYEQMLKEQDGKCAVCFIEEKYTENSRLCVDHNHETGEIRGLLCKKCNQALGLLQDNADFCESAGRYLRLHD